MEEKFNNEQEERQFRQFQEYQNNKKKRKEKRKKSWLFGCGGCLVLLILIIIGVTACTGSFVNEVDKEINEEGKLDKDKDTKIKSVGETTEIDGVSFTLDSASYTDERNEFAEVQADKVLKVDMTIKTTLKKKFQWAEM